eukprot:6207192-Pleurochrysis_carterae.AAC.2
MALSEETDPRKVQTASCESVRACARVCETRKRTRVRLQARAMQACVCAQGVCARAFACVCARVRSCQRVAARARARANEVAEMQRSPLPSLLHRASERGTPRFPRMHEWR